MNIIEITPYLIIENQNYSDKTVISIKKESFEGVDFQDGRFTFSFIGCKFQKVEFENLEEIDFKDISIQFADCKIDDIKIENIVSENISLLLSSSIVSGVIKSEKMRSVVANNTFSTGLFLLNQNNVEISFTEENIFPKRWRKLLRNIRVDYLTLLKTKQYFYVYDAKKIAFSINENDSSKRTFYKRAYEYLEENNIGYYLTDAQKNLININLSIKYSKDIEKQVTKISNSSLNSLSIMGNLEGVISIENTKINNLYISDFACNGEASFYNIFPLKLDNGDNKIGIHKSNLDGVWFDNVNFDQYNRISLYRTKISKAIFTSCNFPDSYTNFEKFTPIENVHYPERKLQNHHKDQYEIFLQLKKALEDTGNYYEGQKLQSIAHDALNKIKTIPITDGVILKINSLSNKHGLSILRPFLWFLGFSIIFYISYLWSLGRIFNSEDIDLRLVGFYFSFIDLTHRTNFLVEKNEFTGLSLTIDYLGKVIFGFLIYQFIAAFRKYRKS